MADRERGTDSEMRGTGTVGGHCRHRAVINAALSSDNTQNSPDRESRPRGPTPP